jgi:hypothetical protein
MTTPMNRRDALKVSAALGGALALSGGILAGCEREQRLPTTGMLSRDQQDLAESVADTILPKTAASPGAKEAGAGAAINLLITDCYEPSAQQLLVQGLRQLDQRAELRFHKNFVDLTRAQREEMLRTISAESKQVRPEINWYPLMHELALRSYFSSEIGMTKALRYMQVPGKWVGCMPYKTGEPAWG